MHGAYVYVVIMIRPTIMIKMWSVVTETLDVVTMGIQAPPTMIWSFWNACRDWTSMYFEMLNQARAVTEGLQKITWPKSGHDGPPLVTLNLEALMFKSGH